MKASLLARAASALLLTTSLALFAFDPARKRFALKSEISAALRASLRRMRVISSRLYSAVPQQPFATVIMCGSNPAFARSERVPAIMNSTSSGCAPTASAVSFSDIPNLHSIEHSAAKAAAKNGLNHGNARMKHG